MAQANLLACGIGLPIDEVEGDLNGLRIGTPEVVRIGAKVEHMSDLADLVARSLNPDADHRSIGVDVKKWRSQFAGVHYTVDLPQ